LNWNPNKELHCCSCKQLFCFGDSQHCTKCCFVNPKNEQHCCFCKKSWKFTDPTTCTCGGIQMILQKIFKEFISDERHAQFGFTIDSLYLSPCLHNDCKAISRFLKGAKAKSLQEALRDISQYTVVIHGTPAVNHGSSICCDGFDTKRRNGQAYGAGEYFTDGFTVPESYCRRDGVYIVSLALKNHPAIVKRTGVESWYIVNHPTSSTGIDGELYVLPFGVIKANDNQIISSCTVCRRNPNYSSLVERKTQEFLDKKKKKLNADIDAVIMGKKHLAFYDETWKHYDSYAQNSIVQTFKQGTLVFNIIISGITYNIDLIRMIQTNNSTGGSRRISFV